MEPEKPRYCEYRHCKKLLVREEFCHDRQWAMKRFCGKNCKQKNLRMYGPAVARSTEWEPTEADIAEIEERKAEIRASWSVGLVFAGLDD